MKCLFSFFRKNWDFAALFMIGGLLAGLSLGEYTLRYFIEHHGRLLRLSILLRWASVAYYGLLIALAVIVTIILTRAFIHIEGSLHSKLYSRYPNGILQGHTISLRIALMLCLFFLGCVFWVAFLAIPYPYELEWFESAGLNMSERVYIGKPMYTAPSIDYIPLVYNPLYALLSGCLAKVVNLSLPTLRSISFGAYLLTLVGVFAFIRDETGDNIAGLLAIGVYAACFTLSGAWYHLARVDSLFVLFLFSGTIQIYRSQRHWQTVFGACLLYVAFLTKQTTILYLPFLTLYLVCVKPRHLLSFLPSIAGLIGITILIGNAWTDGLYYFYIFAFQPQRGFKLKHVMEYIDKFRTPLLLLSMFTISSSWYLWEKFRALARAHIFYLYITLVSFAITCAALSQAGGYYNNMMPSYLWMAVCIGVNMHHISKQLTTQITSRAIWNVLLCVSLSAFLYNPAIYIPQSEDYTAGQHVVDTIAALPQPVWIPHTTSYYFLTGKKSYAHYMTIWDTRRCGRDEFRQIINRQIDDAIRNRVFSAVILGSPRGNFQELLEEQGYITRKLLPNHNGLSTKTGMPVRPDIILYREPALIQQE